MKYWVVRGAPRENDFDSMFEPGLEDTWRTKQPPSDWEPGDRLIFWASSPQREIVALGEFLGETDEYTDDDELLYEVRYRTGLLANRLGIAELRRDPIAGTAIFLKLGPATSVVRLTKEEGERIYQLVRQRNPSLKGPWPLPQGVVARGTPAPVSHDDDMAFAEGNQALKEHLVRERNQTLVKRKRESVLKATGRLRCEACDFDFLDRYGELGRGFAEVHHRVGLSHHSNEVITRLEDLAVVCSNCHRMLHRRKPLLSVKALRKLLSRQVGV